MNLKQIRLLAQMMQQHDLKTVSIEEGETKILLERNQPVLYTPSEVTAPVYPAFANVPAAANEPPAVPVQAPGSGVDFNQATAVTAPMVGVFHEAPAPGAQPYVSVGSKVKKGDVLCILEAMKLMNEILCEQDGEIVDICVKEGDLVEFGQTLFKIC